MMSRRALVPLVVFACVAACKPTEIGPGASRRDDASEVSKSMAPVKLPPAIVASRQYRCEDNGLAFVDFYADDMSASVSTAKGGAATRLAAPVPGGTLVADGFSLKGGKADDRIVLSTPDHPKARSCHV